MASLKEVKNRISSVVSTQQITKAMKMVAASRLRKSQERIHYMRPFAEKLSSLLQNLSNAQDSEPSWYSQTREEQKVLLIPVSSDRGLCGSFNINIAKQAMRLIEEKYKEQHRRGQVHILPLGKKAFEFFGKRNFPLEAAHWHIFAHLTFENASVISEYVMDAFAKGAYDKVEIIYNEFKNVATQIVRSEQYLPVAPSVKRQKSALATDYIFQPARQDLVEGLIPKALKVQLFKALVDSNASENGARVTAMEKATENAGELLKELRLTYNRTRQAAITTEILEIVAGAEALKGA